MAADHVNAVRRQLAARTGDGVYKSCPWIEEDVFIDGTKAKMCCIRNMGNSVVPTFFEIDDPVEAAQKLLESKRGLRIANQTDRSPCAGCFLLKEKHWQAKDHLLAIGISGFLHCNLACTYCSTYQNDPTDRGSPTLSTLKAWYEIGFIRAGCRFEMGGGKSTLHREFDAIAQFAFDRDMSLAVYTNGVGVSRVLLDGLRKGLTSIMISVDAGTRDTYRRIKKKDVLDRVWESIKTYASINPKEVFVKYIMMSSNSSKSELDAFLDRLQGSGANQFFVASNVLQNLHASGDLPDDLKRAMAYLLKYQRLIGTTRFSETVSPAMQSEISDLATRDNSELFSGPDRPNSRGNLELAFTNTPVFLDRAKSIIVEHNSFVVQFSSPIDDVQPLSYLKEALDNASDEGATINYVHDHSGQQIGVEVTF